MDADKWSDYYRREKDSDGFKEAATSLIGGMLREMKSRADRAGPLADAADPVRETDELYRDVASQHRELSPDGFARYLQLESPHLYSLLETGNTVED